MSDEKIDKIARRNSNIALILSAISLLLILTMFGMVTDNEWHIEGLHMNQRNIIDDVYSNTKDIENIEESIMTAEITNTSISENLLEFKKIDVKKTYSTTTNTQPRSD